MLGDESGKQALTEQATAQVVSVRASKKQQIETYFRTMRDTFGVFGDDVAVVSATSLCKDGFNQLGQVRLPDERRRKLEDFYRKSFLPVLAKRSLREVVLFENVWPRTDKSIEAQTLFIAENPASPERSRLVDHPISNPYTLAHFTYHPWFRDVAQRLKPYDLMLVDADTGAIVYSVMKEPDFATSLIDGPHANTNVSRLFRQIVSEHKKGLVRMSDFENYAPSNFDPSMFIATPVYSNYKLTGVLVGQLSVEEISRTMNGEKSWLQDGLGKTGNACVAGPGMLLRSEHRGIIEEKDAFLAQLKANGYAEQLVEDIREANTGILRLPMNIEGVRRAMQGGTGTVNAPDTRGLLPLQAFTPLNISDLSWDLVAQINQDEILEPQYRFQRNLMILACALALATTLAAMGLASRFLRPVEKLIDGLGRMRQGATGVMLTKTSDDEFGRLTDSFNDMHRTIREKDRVIADKSKAHEALLGRLFLPTIAFIPKGSYDGQQFDVRTFGVLATLMATTDVSDIAVYSMVRAIFEGLDELKAMQPVLAGMSPERMIKDGLTAPLHPGALRYYQERGWIKEDKPAVPPSVAAAVVPVEAPFATVSPVKIKGQALKGKRAP